ncbi:ABC transporter ATP-binding protein [Flagellimonas allohymeniacidonis]|uniref:ABC transporter ATP-binding protein n=1 Tax=Flagellimonas allohymeniacidonis TaxID=2517819 RepID=UPI0028BD7CEB|nr:ABC transporter ATP-binding protein [Allomuricauda hymeniacidonis]
MEDISFQVEKGEYIALMGESGSGKSTVLKIIYGLLHMEKGSIFWQDKQALGPNFNLVPGESYMKFLSQDFDLMPFTTVEENIAEHLSVFTRESHDTRVAELLQLIGLEAYAKTKVKNLSGGQQQRVALAKVLAQEPEVLLLDEPFGHIDNFKRNILRRNLFAYLKEKGITVVTASHDPNDVLPYADRMLVLKDGRAIAHNTTRELFENPPDYYVASLFGEVNQVPIQLLKAYAPMDKLVLIYPHEFKFSDASGLKVEVVNSYYKGTHFLNEGTTETGFSIYFNSPTPLSLGNIVFLNIPLEKVNLRLRPKDSD